MHKFLFIGLFLKTLFFMALAHAQPVYKCQADGKTSYADRPCPGATVLPLAPAGVSLSDGLGGGTVTTGDARTLLELEKVRTERAKQAAIEGREQRARARAGRVTVKQAQHCDKLKLQHRWLEEDAAAAGTPAHQAAARTKLKRQEASMAVECPA